MSDRQDVATVGFDLLPAASQPARGEPTRDFTLPMMRSVQSSRRTVLLFPTRAHVHHVDRVLGEIAAATKTRNRPNWPKREVEIA